MIFLDNNNVVVPKYPKQSDSMFLECRILSTEIEWFHENRAVIEDESITLTHSKLEIGNVQVRLFYYLTFNLH